MIKDDTSELSSEREFPTSQNVYICQKTLPKNKSRWCPMIRANFVEIYLPKLQPTLPLTTCKNSLRQCRVTLFFAMIAPLSSSLLHKSMLCRDIWSILHDASDEYIQMLDLDSVSLITLHVWGISPEIEFTINIPWFWRFLDVKLLQKLQIQEKRMGERR